ncbi:hypothetical protein AVEN_148882-1 [Araneus ventricosus]|uniref:HTH CENPB-type domain-containing protein n=1 Tax=Araneus ventricosus TaxID=182803 RepID=A0A4Y2DIB3_ARAVE|nr:hypothetical protein AVEN_148882-1 [Araneus ventricosus]
MDEELRKYCRTTTKWHFCLQYSDIKHIAFQRELRNGIPHPFTNHRKATGQWLRGILKRSPNFLLKKTEMLSSARAKGFNADSVNILSKLYELELRKVIHTTHNLLNVDETGIKIVKHKKDKAIDF